MKISRRRLADYVKTLHQKACRTCSAIIFPHLTNEIIDFWHCRSRCRRHFLNCLIQKIHVIIWQTTSKKCIKKRAARATRLFFLTQQIKSMICGVVVADAVITS